MNKGGWRVNKHVELCTKNTFDECKVFWGFDIEKFIIDFFEMKKV